MATNPTIVIGSLNDKELTESINKLVQTVGTQSLKMAQEFDKGIQLMRESIRSLGREKINITHTSGGTRNLYADEIKKEKESVERAAISYDKLSSARNRAMSGGERFIYLTSDVDKYFIHVVDLSKNVDAQLDAILRKEQELVAQKQAEAQITREISNEQAKLRGGVSGAPIAWGNVHEMHSRNLHRGSSTAGEIDYLRQQMAALLNVKERDIKKTEIQAATYGQLDTYLKQLQKAYRSLSFDNLKREGGDIAQEIQKVQRALQQMQKQMLRPVNLSAALGNPEKTIDDITYKIQQLQLYKRGINLTDPKQAQELKAVDAELNRLQKDLYKYTAGAKRASEVNNALARSWNYMKNRLAFYFTAGASTQFVRNLIEVRSQYEMNERALGILIGSAERGTQVFQELSQMSLVSPYTLIELSAAAKQLTAYDIAAKDVVDTTRRIADMAAAVGVPIERLTYALGQIKAYGYLNSRDARMFLNAGIPLVKQLAERYTQLEGRLVSVGDVYDRIKKKAVGYADVMQVITEMTDEGGRFFDFQAKMADTLKVRLANLTLAWNNMLNEMGESNQGYMTSGIKLLTEFFKHWRDVEKAFLNVVWGFGIMKALQYATLRFYKLNHAVASTAVLGEKAAASMNGFAASITKAASKGWNWILVGIMAGVDFYQTWQNASEAVEEFNRTVAKNAEESGKNLREWRLQAESVYGGVTSGRNLKAEDAGKAWEDMRKQIEMSSQASQRFIGSLEQIPDINKRLRAGFDVVGEIQKAHAALQDLGEDSIQINQEWSAWWNLWSANDGLKNNLKDFVKLKDEASGFNLWSTLWDAVASAGLLGAIHKIAESITSIRASLQGMTPDELRFKEDIDAMAESMVNQSMNLSATAAREFFDKIAEDYVLSQNLSATEALTFRMHLEEAYSNKRKALYQKESASMAEENIRTWDAAFGKSKALVEDFYNFLGRNNQSVLLQLFKDKDAAEIDAIAKSDKAWKNFINKQAKTFAEQRNIEFETLWKEINNINANAKIFIPVILQFTEKSELQKEVDRASTGLNIHIDVANASTTYEVAQNLLKRKNEIQEALRGIGDATTDRQRQEKAAYESELAATNAVLDNLGYANLRTKQELKDARAAAAARKRAAAQQRAAESELQKTLNNELKIIDKVRARYKELGAAGYDRTTAIQKATDGFMKSQNEINKVFAKWGLEALDLSKLAGATNPREIFNVLQEQLNKLIVSGKVKPLEIQELETKVTDLKLDADKFDATTLIDSLNSEFAKIKDEYELALSLDEYPELGDAFSSMLGIPKEGFDKLPRDLYALGDRLQDAITDILSKRGYRGSDIFNIFSGVRVEDWAEQIKVDKGSALYKSIDDINKFFVDTTRKTLTEVEKEYTNLVKKRGELADKIGEIEATRLRRQRELENSYANRQNEKMSVRYTSKVEAINKDAIREEADAYFEAFKNTPYYVNMFENLQYVGSRTLRTMKNDLDKLRTSLSGLSPQNVKEIVQQMEKIDEELIKKNPFRNLTSNFKSFVQARTEIRDVERNASEAHERASVEEQVLALWEKKRAQAVAKGNEDEVKAWDKKIAKQREAVRLAKGEEEAEQGKLHTLQKQIQTSMQQTNEVWKVISTNIASLGGLRDYMVEMGVDVGDWLNGAIDGLTEFNDGINQIISSALNLDVLGTLTGVIKSMHGIMDSIVSIFGGGSAKEHRIDKELKRSEQLVKSLQYAYLDLQYAMEDAYGAAVAGAKRVALANKQLELQEIQRQIRLEESRSKKKRDQDRILELRQQYKELSREIKTSTDEIVEDLLGSDRANFAENLVSSMIDAFKQGEAYMQTFEESFEQMVDNMIMKAIVSKVVAQYMDSLFDGLNNRIEERSADERAAFQDAQKQAAKVETLSDEDIRRRIAEQRYKEYTNRYGYGSYDYINALSSVTPQDIADYRKAAEDALKAAETRYAAVSAMTDSDIDWVMAEIAEKSPELAEMIKNLLGNYYKFGEANKELSQLQQGIQGITETTANALEAYMNGVSQQVYLHSDLLTQIRDAVVSFDMDVQTATMGQILLQLQASYNAQMAIQSTLEGWNAPNGMAVRVQMV